jgi:hypothetical protein
MPKKRKGPEKPTPQRKDIKVGYLGRLYAARRAEQSWPSDSSLVMMSNGKGIDNG